MAELERDAEKVALAVRSGSERLVGMADLLLESQSATPPSAATDTFLHLRHLLTCTALAYGRKHLPKSCQLVRKLLADVEYYDALDFDDFCSEIAVTALQMKQHHQSAKQVKDDHVELLTHLEELKSLFKSLQTEQKLEVKERKTEEQILQIVQRIQEHWEERKHSLARFWDRLFNWDCSVFGGIPILSLGIGATSNLQTSARKLVIYFCTFIAARVTKIVTSTQKGSHKREAKANAQMACEAAELLKVLEGPLMEAMKDFLEGIQEVTFFIGQLEEEISGYAEEEQEQEGIRLHFPVIQKKSKNIIAACKLYSGVIPIVQAKLNALRSVVQVEGIDSLPSSSVQITEEE